MHVYLTDITKRVQLNPGGADAGQLVGGLEAGPLGGQPLVAGRLPVLGRLSFVAIRNLWLVRHSMTNGATLGCSSGERFAGVVV